MRWAASGTSPRRSGPRAPTPSWCSRPITVAPLWLSESISSRPAWAGMQGRPVFDAFDEGHSRLVRRRVFMAPAVQDLKPLHGWPDLRAVLAVETIRSVNAVPTHSTVCLNMAVLAAGNVRQQIGSETDTPQQ